MSRARALSCQHWVWVIFLRSLWYGHGAMNSSFPRAQASNWAPPGFHIGVRPFSSKTISFIPASKAARMTLFSHGLMLGDTSTAPSLAMFM